MDNYIVIDFETRSSVDIKKGATPYVNACEPICLSIKPKQGKVQVFFFEEIKPICIKLLNFSKRNKLVAHNASFDFKVFQKVTNCEDIVLSRFIDTSILSSYCGGPVGLYPASIFWDLDNTKDFGKDLIQTLCIPVSRKTPKTCRGYETKNMKRENGFIVDDKLFKLLGNYCMKDVQTTEELLKKLNFALPEFFKQKVYFNNALNYFRNKRGLSFDIEKVKLLKETFDNLTELYKKFIKKVTKNPDFNIDSPLQIKAFLKKHGFSVDTTQAHDLLEIKTDSKLINTFIKLVLTRPTKVGKKFHTILENEDNGVIKDSIFFHDSVTGRYQSREPLGALNMPRKLESSNVYEDIKNKSFFTKYKFDSYKIIRGQMRSCLIPHKGCEFIGGDFSAIELKLLLAEAGEFSKLEKLQKGFDFYKFMASKVFNKDLKDVTTKERYIAKRATLAFGYGMGLVLLIDTLRKDSIHLESKKALKLKDFYFESFPKVKNFWYKLFQPFTKIKSGEDVQVKVPFSGKTIYFRDVKIDRVGDFKQYSYRTRKGGREGIYHSKVGGIVTQSLAVGVFHEAERRLYDRFKLLVDLPVHDEFVCSVKKGTVSLEEFKDCIETPPKWLPFKKVNSEVWKGDCYKK